MVQGKTEITICFGSSCFARGNNETRHAIARFLNEHGLEDKVFFHGSHCCNNCMNGPVVVIEGKTHEKVNSLSIIDILTEHFKI